MKLNWIHEHNYNLIIYKYKFKLHLRNCGTSFLHSLLLKQLLSSCTWITCMEHVYSQTTYWFNNTWSYHVHVFFYMTIHWDTRITMTVLHIRCSLYVPHYFSEIDLVPSWKLTTPNGHLLIRAVSYRNRDYRTYCVPSKLTESYQNVETMELWLWPLTSRSPCSIFTFKETSFGILMITLDHRDSCLQQLLIFIFFLISLIFTIYISNTSMQQAVDCFGGHTMSSSFRFRFKLSFF